MNVKNRRLYKKELDLWKRVTQNDKKYNSYIREDEIIKEIEKPKEKVILKVNQKKHDNETKEKSEGRKKKDNLIYQANRKTISKLERGKLKPEAYIDLHGFNQLEAKAAVYEFIKTSINNERRCILIITGKKNSYMGAKGILRESLPKWLKESDISHYILGHSYANIKDGGDGARYVLLRKKDKVLIND